MSPAGAAAQLGLIGLLQFVPLFLSTPVTGWVADRFDRRWITRVTVSLQILCAFILAMATYEGWMSLPVLFSVAVLLGLGRAFAGPAFSALAPDLVPREVLPTAIALSSISWQVGTIIGPAIGGFAYSFAPSAAYFLATALFSGALLCLMMIGPVARTIAVGTAHPLKQIADGLAYVWQNKMILGTITLDLFAVFLAGTSALLPIYAHDILKVGPQGLSALAAAPAVGAALTALFFSFRPLKTNVGPKMLGAVLVYGSATVLFGLSTSMPLSLIALVHRRRGRHVLGLYPSVADPAPHAGRQARPGRRCLAADHFRLERAGRGRIGFPRLRARAGRRRAGRRRRRDCRHHIMDLALPEHPQRPYIRSTHDAARRRRY